jgi:hypothetical protein
MRRIEPGALVVPILAALALHARAASAQEPPPPAPAPAPAPAVDPLRFRGGISFSGGGMFVSGYALGMFGIDGRVGVQINDLVGVYAQPYISLGGGRVPGTSGLAFNTGATLNADFTFIDHVFVGAGGGGGLVGSVGGGQIHVRAGGYPVMRYGKDGVRRRGFMIGADLSVHFAAGLVLVQPMVGIGYEAF